MFVSARPFRLRSVRLPISTSVSSQLVVLEISRSFDTVVLTLSGDSGSSQSSKKFLILQPSFSHFHSYPFSRQRDSSSSGRSI